MSLSELYPSSRNMEIVSPDSTLAHPIMETFRRADLNHHSASSTSNGPLPKSTIVILIRPRNTNWTAPMNCKFKFSFAVCETADQNHPDFHHHHDDRTKTNRLNPFNEHTNKLTQSIKSIINNMINIKQPPESIQIANRSRSDQSGPPAALQQQQPRLELQLKLPEQSASGVRKCIPVAQLHPHQNNSNSNSDSISNSDANDDQQQIVDELNFAWPDSFIQLLDSLSNQQQQQQLDNIQSIAATNPRTPGRASISPSFASSSSVSSLAIDDRDFELLALKFDCLEPEINDIICNKTDRDPLDDRRSLWLMNFCVDQNFDSQTLHDNIIIIHSPEPQRPPLAHCSPKSDRPLVARNGTHLSSVHIPRWSTSGTGHSNTMNRARSLSFSRPDKRKPAPDRKRRQTLPTKLEPTDAVDVAALKSQLDRICLAALPKQEPDQECADKQPQLDNQPAISLQSQQQDHELEPSSTPYEATRQVANHDDGKYSLLQFALYNFREAIDKYSLESRATKLGPQMDVGDTSTLRGSLKLIESLRGSHSAQQSAETNKSAKTASGASSGQFEPSSVKGRHRRGPPEWTWRELAEMVKFTPSPIRQSLLRLPTDDLNRRALDCFQAIMAYMGDLESAGSQAGSGSQSKSSQLSCKPMGEVECVYLILMNCHNYPILRDEIYCQLMKQTTNNRSSNPDSCLRGWRLFSIVAAYFDCSDHFRPYLLNYLETAAYDKRRAYCSVALLCLQNLRKTLKYLGRKNVPSIEEIAATSAGRNSKRQIYRLPGGTERVINTKSTTVVDDIIHEICTNTLNISEPDEMLEFSLYCIADGDLYTMPLNRDEYILDITTELIKNHQQYFLIFCRSIWHFPLRLESKLYIEVIFNQIAPDYLEGLLLVLPGLGRAGSRLSGMPEQPLRLKTKLVKEVARIGALLHRASGTDYMPHKDEVKYLLPKPIISSMKQLQRRSQDQSCSSASSSSANSDRRRSGDENLQSLKLGVDAKLDTVVTSPQKWIELVQSNWREMSAFDTLDAKAQFLDIIRHWPLFGSSFFAIKLIQRDLIQPTDFILALNKFGIQMLDTVSHETIHRYPFNEVISTRKVRSEDGALYLDLKCGNLMKRTIIRIQTDQAHEISRLTRQYIDIELIQQQKQQHGQAGRAQTDSARLSAQYSVAGSSNEGISDQ